MKKIKARSNTPDTDIREVVDQQIIENAPLLQAVFDASVDAISVYKAIRNTNGEIIDFVWLLANHCMRSLTGINDLAGKYHSDVFRQSRQTGIFDIYKAVLDTGKSHNWEVYYPDGGMAGWYHLSAVRLDDGLVVTCENITARIKAEQERQAYNSELSTRNLINNYAEAIANMGTWTWNMQTNKAVYSDNMFRLFGMQPQEVEPTFETIPPFIHPDDRKLLLDMVPGIKKREPLGIEYRVIRKDGVQRIFVNRVRIEKNDHGEDIVVGVTQDITEQKKAEVELKALNKALVRKNKELRHRNAELLSFAKVTSHDLKEPLRKIYTFIELLLGREIDNLSFDGRSHFKRIQASVQRMSLLTDDMLTFAQLHAEGKKRSPVDLNNILDEAKLQLADTISTKKAVVHNTILPGIKGYRDMLVQLFQHIMANALKFQEKDNQPYIEISAAITPGSEIPNSDAVPDITYWKISFADNGIGFELEYADLIFEMFRRLHTSETYPGTGLGLALCKKIAELHGGFITVESKKGEGSIFHCYFPAKA